VKDLTSVLAFLTLDPRKLYPNLKSLEHNCGICGVAPKMLLIVEFSFAGQKADDQSKSLGLIDVGSSADLSSVNSCLVSYEVSSNKTDSHRSVFWIVVFLFTL
jgi:uncharacterized UBP type Zn finger protein